MTEEKKAELMAIFAEESKKRKKDLTKFLNDNIWIISLYIEDNDIILKKTKDGYKLQRLSVSKLAEFKE